MTTGWLSPGGRTIASIREGESSTMDKPFPNILLIINEAINPKTCCYWKPARYSVHYCKCCKRQEKKLKSGTLPTSPVSKRQNKKPDIRDKRK